LHGRKPVGPSSQLITKREADVDPKKQKGGYLERKIKEIQSKRVSLKKDDLE
jgi:hypothetical protein